MTTTAKGRRRVDGALAFLDRYPAATTDQLAALIWAGDNRLARRHLLKLLEAGHLDRVPHPLYRNGAYVWMLRKRGGRQTSHSQKVLHHLQAVAFHIATIRVIGHRGARVTPELPWGTGVQPDQTVQVGSQVWAIEHHLSGPFGHGPDYRRFIAEEEYELSPFWKPGLQLGLLVVTAPNMVEPIRALLMSANLPRAFTWSVAQRDQVLRDPSLFLRSAPRFDT